jgi:hypothetical protein
MCDHGAYLSSYGASGSPGGHTVSRRDRTTLFWPSPIVDAATALTPHPYRVIAIPSQWSHHQKLAQLKQLGDLKEQGVLTDAEFEMQKHKILHG